MTPWQTMRRHPGFWALIGLAALIAVAEGGWIYVSREAMIVANRRATALSREMATKLKVSPSLTDEAAEGMVNDVRALQTLLRQMREALSGGELAKQYRAAAVPSERRDAFFELETYMKSLRERVQAQGVKTTADERFGFLAYANEGPERAAILPVFRQRQMLGYLLSSLLDEQPQELIKVARTANGAELLEASRDRDTFEMDPRLSVQIEGVISTQGYQIEFVAETAVLRRWLNRLAQFDLPIVVRAVEVEPVVETGLGASSRPIATTWSAAEVPLIAASPSRIKVTLESLEFLDATPPEDAR